MPQKNWSEHGLKPGSVRLWYHAESDSLFLDTDEHEHVMVCDDVTDDPRFRVTALARGLKTRELPPLPATKPEDHIAEVTSHTMADAIVKSYKRWERKPADLYPTPVDATESIIDVLKVMGAKRVWEPACANGLIGRVLEWHGIEVIGTDIRECISYGVGGLDFINEDPLEKWGWDVGQIDAIITNPPFSLAREFIEKALTISPNVIMLVKQNYYNVVGRYDFFQDLRPSFFLPLTWRLAFLPERGKSPLMDCAWAVWTDQSEEPGCIMEPVKKKVYPGYHGPGLRSGMADLAQALDDLTGVLRGTSG